MKHNEIETERAVRGLQRRKAGLSIQCCIPQLKTSISCRLVVHHRPRGDHDLAFGLLDVRPGALDHGLLVGLRVALLELVEDVEADSSIAAEWVAAGLLEVLVQLGLQLLLDGDERRGAGRLVTALILTCRAHVCPRGGGIVGVGSGGGGFAGRGL